jgi:hypothetical protein
LRNELVNYLDRNELPELKNEERYCSKCPHLTICSLLNDMEEKKSADHHKINVENFYINALSHLNEEHRKYFFKWYKMLEFEFSDYKQFDAGISIWWNSKEYLESTGYCVFNLKLCQETLSNKLEGQSEYTGERFYLFEFEKNKNELDLFYYHLNVLNLKFVFKKLD